MDNEFEKLQNLMPILAIYDCKRARARGGIKNQVDQGARNGHSKYSSIQENAQAHADRTDLSHGAVAECLPGKIRSVRDTVPMQNCVPTQAGCEALQVAIWDVLQGS